MVSALLAHAIVISASNPRGIYFFDSVQHFAMAAPPLAIAAASAFAEATSEDDRGHPQTEDEDEALCKDLQLKITNASDRTPFENKHAASSEATKAGARHIESERTLGRIR